jgi:hypothetical protein
MSQASSRAQTGIHHPPKRERDLRLDFYRGLGDVHHLHRPHALEPVDIVDPRPVRLFGRNRDVRVLLRHGLGDRVWRGVRKGRLADGAARIVHRIWQVYWAHICLFLIVAGMLFAADQTGWFWRNYTNSLNLTPFVNIPGNNYRDCCR